MSSGRGPKLGGETLGETFGPSFIIKTWLEENVEETGRAIWRGHITHVPSGERRYLTNLSEMIAFILPYLRQMGVRFTLRWRVQQWIEGARTYLRMPE